MNVKIQIVSVLVLLFVGGCKKNERPDFNQKLWYNYPAKYWNSQSLHLGNGYFGASFFGGLEKETFALTEQSMWTGEPAMGEWEKAAVNPSAKEAIPKIREAVLNGQAKVADDLLTNEVFGSSEKYGFFTSIGDLLIEFENHKSDAGDYQRELDLQKSLGKVKYTMNDIYYEREYFCSYPNRILGMKFTSDKANSLSFGISLQVIQDSSLVEIDENTYRLIAYINGNHRPFHVLIQVNNKGGELKTVNKKLVVENANSAEILLTIATNYKMEYPAYIGEDPRTITDKVMDEALALGYEKLKAKHIADYRNLYDRVRFDIPGNPEAEILPTNERFERLRKGKTDPGYKILAFNLGRYMVISSSRPGTLPANLQGVWNTFFVAPWAGNYQSNVNLQEIYWSCGSTNLLECQQAYIDWIENLTHSGKEVAQRLYGTKGWISHTVGNIWGHAGLLGGHPWGMYSMGSAWHCQHVWDHYRFSQDEGYLRNQGYPILKDASIFWLENLIPFKGYLITAPTVSAEHGALKTEEGLNPAFHDFESDDYVYSLTGVYQDIEMLWDLFTNTSKAAKIIGEPQFADSLLKVRAKLLPLKIGKYGQLQEWYQDIDHPDCHHRHISHLYALCPGSQIHPHITPDLAEAAKISLNMRGDGRFLEQEVAAGGNWSRAHRMWCWTRLLDGNRANKIMTEILTEQGFENVLTHQHAPYSNGRDDLYKEDGLFLHYQLDASASLPGCIAEMLVQSHLNEIHLLPALPDEFKTGKISGIKARGNYELNLEWERGELLKAEIICPEGNIPTIRLKDAIIDPESEKRITLIFN